MPEINLNLNFADLLKNHGISVEIGDEFIQTNLPDNVKFEARSECKRTQNWSVLD